MAFQSCKITKNQFFAITTLIIFVFVTIIICVCVVKLLCTEKNFSANINPTAKLYLNSTNFTLDKTIKIVCRINNLFSGYKNEYYVHFSYMSSPPQDTEWEHQKGKFSEIGYYRVLVINSDLFSKTWSRYKFEYGTVSNASCTKPQDFSIMLKMKKIIPKGKIGCAVKWTEENEVWKTIS